MTRKIACIGVGTIGSSWASLFAWNKYEVNIYDESDDAIRRALELIKANLETLSTILSEPKETAKKAFDRIHVVANLEEALDNVWYVQESVFESYEVKKPLFYKMDEIAPSNTILATSTSGLLITEIQKAAKKHPERCIIAHPWNPPHIIPLVEVIPGPLTTEKVITKTMNFMDGLGKKTVLVKKDVPGQIGNRLSAALWREAVDLVNRGIVTAEDVDTVIKYGPGLRWALMGIFLTYHLGGGVGGIDYFLKKGFGQAFEMWWEDMAKWDRYPDESLTTIIEQVRAYGILKQIDYKSLTGWRDKKIVELLKLVEDH
jgi:3-hydroxypropionate dehydrogenase (NADP+)